MTVRILAIASILGLLVVDAAAEQEELIHLKGGRFYHGVVLSSTPTTLTGKVKNADGVYETHTVPAEECDDYFFYGVRNRHIGKDAKARIELAKWCVDHDMFSRAKAQMDQARAADPKVVEEFMTNEFPKIKEGLAAKLLKAGQRSLKRSSPKNALKYASLILTKFEGTKAVAGAEKLADEAQSRIDAKQEKQRAHRRRTAEAKEAAKTKTTSDQRDKILAPIEKLIDQGEEHNTRGLKAKGLSDSKGQFETAASRFESAVKRCDTALQGELGETGTKAIQEARANAVAGGISAYLNLAHTYSARGSYKKATDYCNAALALDPNNAEAKSARAQISTTAGGWGMRRGGRR